MSNFFLNSNRFFSQRHGFHLVDPSPWPLASCFSLRSRAFCTQSSSSSLPIRTRLDSTDLFLSRFLGSNRVPLLEHCRPSVLIALSPVKPPFLTSRSISASVRSILFLRKLFLLPFIARISDILKHQCVPEKDKNSLIFVLWRLQSTDSLAFEKFCLLCLLLISKDEYMATDRFGGPFDRGFVCIDFFDYFLRSENNIAPADAHRGFIVSKFGRGLCSLNSYDSVIWQIDEYLFKINEYIFFAAFINKDLVSLISEPCTLPVGLLELETLTLDPRNPKFRIFLNRLPHYLPSNIDSF